MCFVGFYFLFYFFFFFGERGGDFYTRGREIERQIDRLTIRVKVSEVKKAIKWPRERAI